MSLHAPVAPTRTGSRGRAVNSRPRRAHVLVAVLVGLLSAGLFCYQLAQPHFLEGVHGYDDGVYLGAALNLIHGIMPYRDFAYLHPPGMPLLLSPVAAVGELSGSAGAMAIARLLTGVVAVANVVLGAWLLRYRGLVAMLTTGLVLAVLPPAIFADQSLSLEPYLVLFCLIGSSLVFSPSGAVTSSRRRIILGGAAFGFACAIKIWALMPIAILVIVCWAKSRRRRTTPWLLAGIAAGVGVPTLPFLLLAPAQFLHDVVITQLVRQSPLEYAAPISLRIRLMTGLAGPPGLHLPGMLAIALLALLAAATAVTYATSSLVALDWYTGLATVVIVGGMCVSKQFYAYYGYFPGVFLALQLGIVTGLASHAVAGWQRISAPAIRRLRVSILAAVLVIACAMIPEYAAVARGYLAGAYNPGPAFASRIPSTACVISDESSLLVAANRFKTTRSCPVVVDPFGQWIADDPANPPPESGHYAPALIQTWRTALGKAAYLMQVAPESDFLPWSPSLLAYFNSHYVLVYQQAGGYLYQNMQSARYAIKSVLNEGLKPVTAAGQLITIGIAAWDSGDITSADAAYSAAARVSPGDKYAYFDLGTIAQRSGDNIVAETEYKRSLLIDPRFGPALYNMGVLETKVHPSQAVSYYLRDLIVQPHNPSADFNLGMLFIRRGNTTMGNILVREAEQLDPSLGSSVVRGAVPCVHPDSCR